MKAFPTFSSTKMKKIGIMGGTFDPPHIGHFAIAKYVKRAMALDEIWFLPTGGITYKESDGLSSPENRLEMVRLLVADEPDFRVESMEAESGKNSYTFETLEALRKKFPEDEFVFIVGADSLDYMDKWREPERIFRNCTVAAVNREGFSSQQCEEKKKMLEEKYHGEIRLITMPAVDVSSTQIRRMVAKGESIKEFVHKDVLTYIKEERLYQNP